jgi:4'-phosphopantetheinyl transferase
MQIRVLSIRLSGNEQTSDFEQIFNRLPSAIKERIHKYKISQERNLKIVGKGLLMKALKDWNIVPEQALANLKYTATQQPFIDGMAIHLSISHSEDLIACAVAESAKIGIDIEKIKPVKLALMKAYLDEYTWQEIINGADPDSLFFRHWTIREAAIKASGFGLEHVELAEVTHSDKSLYLRGEAFYYEMIPISHNHASCIASDHEIKNIEIVQLSLSDLL